MSLIDVSGVAKRSRAAVMAVAVSLVLAACSFTFVAPYDQDLVNGVSTFQKDASVMLQKLEAAGMDGKYETFAGDYQSLIGQADALLTRAIAGSKDIDKLGQKISTIANNVVSKATGGNPAAYKGMSLTAAQIYDLRSLIVQWQTAHKVTPQPAPAWEVRKSQLDSAILAIMTLELSKKGESQ